VRNTITAVLWIAPLTLHSADAWAWGLYTHLYFAQLLLWAIPLADARFRRAAKRFPELLLAGACLPDVSLFSGWVRDPRLAATHQWSVARRLLQNADHDEHAALAAGYCSHLLSDIVAHNHFVPAHETLWLNPLPLAVHAASEWAMDAHLAGQLYARPHRLLRRHLPVITGFAARHFGSTPDDTRRALRFLAHGEQWLRGSGLHQAAYRGARLMDAGVTQRFDYYVMQTTQRLEQMNRVIAGDAPAWAPEVSCAAAARNKINTGAAAHSPRFIPLPRDFFSGNNGKYSAENQVTDAGYSKPNDSAAITAPSSAPASTSLG
jgi:Zinc dependent phospholipase C